MSREDSERARHRQRQARYEARQRALSCTLSAIEIDALVAGTGGACFFSKRPLSGTGAQVFEETNWFFGFPGKTEGEPNGTTRTKTNVA